MNNITEIKVEDYLKDKLPQIDASNENNFLAEMGITKNKGEYVLDHNKFTKYIRKYIIVVYQNNRSELAIYNYSQKKYEINYVNVLLEKIVKFFLSYVKELWTPKWEEVIIKTLKAVSLKLKNNTIVGKEPQSYDNSSTDLDQNGQDNTAETRIFR